MELSPGYNLSPSWAKQLVILDWIRDNGGDKTGIDVTLSPLFQQREQAGKRALASDLTDFQDRGWLKLQQRLGFDSWSCLILPAGIDFIDEVRRRRGDTVGRRRAARDAVLRWLYDRKAAGEAYPVMTHERMGSYALYYGHAFTNQETDDAAKWLREQGYLRGQGSMGAGIARPSITALGEQMVETGRPLYELDPPSFDADAPVAVTVSMTGSHQNLNLAANSPGAIQSATMSDDDRQQVIQVADALEHMRDLLGLDAATTKEAEQVVSDLRSLSAELAPDRGRLRTAFDKAAAIAITGTGTAAGQALVALVQQTAQALGLA